MNNVHEFPRKEANATGGGPESWTRRGTRPTGESSTMIRSQPIEDESEERDVLVRKACPPSTGVAARSALAGGHSSRFWLEWGTKSRRASYESSDTSWGSSGSPSPGLTSWPSTCPHCCRVSDLSAACPSCPGRCLPVQELNSASSPCHR